MSKTVRLEIKIAIAAAFLLIFLSTDLCLAQDPSIKLPELPVLKNGKIDRTGQAVPAGRKKASRKYDGGGRVDRIGEEELVVNDFSLRLAKDVVYHAPQGQGLSPKLEIGSMILYKLNEKREIVSIWFAAPQQSSGEE